MGAYIGPRFGLRERLMFIGYDHGTDRGDCVDIRRRREHMLNWRVSSDGWNGHYHGCVAQAALLFGLNDCLQNCSRRCSLGVSADVDCAYLHLLQTNSVKSVPKGSESMAFRQRHLIKKHLPFLIEELAAVQPDIVVVHGKQNHAPIQEICGDKLTMINDHFGHLFYGENSSAYVAFFRHPSRNQHNADWRAGIVPDTLGDIKKRIFADRDGGRVRLLKN